MSLPWVRITRKIGPSTQRILDGVKEATVLKWDDGNGNVVLRTDHRTVVKVKKNKVHLERLDK